MKRAEINPTIEVIATWATKHDDIRAMALVGSWARGNPRLASDVDLLLLSDRQDEYRRRGKWLAEIEFESASYRLRSSKVAAYGVVWSRHRHLLPAADVELTFSERRWASTDPVDGGTCAVVKDAFRIIFDKDGILQRLVAAVASE